MTPAARFQACVDLMDSITDTPRPADGVVSAFFRTRRYIGSKDRRAIGDAVWEVLRTWARTGWWVQRALSSVGVAEADIPAWNAIASRQRLLAVQVLVYGASLPHLEALCNGERYAPPRLSSLEKALVRALRDRSVTHSDQPDWIRYEIPEWVLPRLVPEDTGDMPSLLEALNTEAPVTVRVNTLKTTPAEALTRLQDDGVAARPGQVSPLALILEQRAHIAATPTFQTGWVEVQDEGSQVVALLTDARPGHAVVDVCAGAGGKTLALAANMNNKGRLVACDVSQGRLERSAQRLKRAGVHNVTSRVLSSERDKWIKRSRGAFDRVLVDAPCSGTGTWRRNPDARWRFDPHGLTELVTLQRSILSQAARLVKPGGRLVYATCSLLTEENDDQIAWFLQQQTEEKGIPSFRIIDVRDLWPRLSVWATQDGNSYPFPQDMPGPFLHMDPARHGTDGFFVAVLERIGEDDTSL